MRYRERRRRVSGRSQVQWSTPLHLLLPPGPLSQAGSAEFETSTCLFSWSYSFFFFFFQRKGVGLSWFGFLTAKTESKPGVPWLIWGPIPESQNKNAHDSEEGGKAQIQLVTPVGHRAQPCWGPSEEPCRMHFWRMVGWGGTIYSPTPVFLWLRNVLWSILAAVCIQGLKY